MSTQQELRDSGIPSIWARQSAGVMRFTLIDEETGTERKGASLYIQGNDRDVHIRVRALENNSFPDSGRLHEFVRRNSSRTLRDPSNPSYAYKIDGAQHISGIIEILSDGLR